MTPAHLFDRLAPRYDQLWTHSAVGHCQRETFWHHARPYFEDAPRILDIGCGTGEDALRLIAAGARVTAIDVSPRMVSIARSRGVDAQLLAAEDIAQLEGPFDAVLSNFGPLNCVESIAGLRDPLAQLLKPEGYAVLCLLSRFCLSETLWFLLKGAPWKALRRWSGAAEVDGVRVHYPSVRRICRDLSPNFTLAAHFGIGVLVPPSDAPLLPRRILDFAQRLDRRISALRAIRSVGDHNLLIFRRNLS